MSKGKRWNVLEATKMPTESDLAWAAGFLEGEGYFGKNKTTVSIEATQKDNWSLIKLQELFGGSLGMIHNQGFHKTGSYYRWRASGPRAREMVIVLKRYLSPWRLEQIDRSF